MLLGCSRLNIFTDSFFFLELLAEVPGLHLIGPLGHVPAPEPITAGKGVNELIGLDHQLMGAPLELSFSTTQTKWTEAQRKSDSPWESGSCFQEEEDRLLEGLKYV